MDLGLLDWIFTLIGRGVCWVIRKLIRRPINLSVGGYTVVGMLFPPALLFFAISCGIFYDWIVK